ncbi:MAG TPA: hypothetical protein VNF24_09330 [Candidatus Acidoferrales bacterium]|nr:hypothetical protein [Candidatus Acidoferrales bacterium]HVC38782.1 hypothetical protein [Candidatus Dormibacteraeota bacterium]
MTEPDEVEQSGSSRPVDPGPAAGQALPRNAASWATTVDRLEVEEREGMRGTNVSGRRLTSPIQGFGRMWQKTYSTSLGDAATPRQVIATWKAHFPEFWPAGNRFAGAMTGISPGDVALLDLAVGGVKLSTGVFVLYADEESFTLMTPEGHMFAGWISFSAEDVGSGTVAQAQVLMRANDPLYELGLTFGGHRQEDRFWAETLTALARRFGVAEPIIATKTVCVDRRRQWRNVGNTWHNAMIRSMLQVITHPRGRSRPRPAGGKSAPHG